jgi:two-component system, OmpR family, osmolarity sensor histidine kinase EnvZ
MFFKWLKQYMPRSLYGRAALILIIPVVTLQFGISLIFIQRHFEDVTVQLTGALVHEFRLIQDVANGAADHSEAGIKVANISKSLNFRIEFVEENAVPTSDYRRFIDITGVTVIRSLRAGIPSIGPILLPNDGDVLTYMPTNFGTLEIAFSRNRASASNPHQLIVWTIGLGILMMVIAYLFLRNQLRPIKRLSYAAEAFGKGRHLPYRPSGAWEVRSAGNAFLEMRTRIERHIEQRTLILSGVSHDLRSPLTRLKLALSMSEDANTVAMQRDVDDMQRLLDEFLSFARRDIEEGLEAEEVEASAFVSAIVLDCADRGEDVSLFQATGTGTIDIKTIAIRRALENLISNAINYGHKAEVSVVVREKSVTIAVEDAGAGIPKDKREEALKPFVRLDPARNQNKATGVGLGLSIAADIARAHGGQLRLGESKRLGGLKAEMLLAR